MAVKVLQRSLAGGEISEECYGRLDLTRYATGLAIARNFITAPHGIAFNRGGFKYILETKDSTKQSVLLPFSFNTEQTYVLEFGDQYIRFHTNGGTLLEAALNITGITQPAGVVTSAGHGYSNGQWVYLTGIGGMTQLNGRYVVVSDAAANTFRMKDFAGNYITTGSYGAYTAGGTCARVYEIASPYLEADLFELHIAQSADVLTITHPGYAPRELSRLSATSWSLATVDFQQGPFQAVNTDRVRYMYTRNKAGTAAATVFDGTTGAITIYSPDGLFEAEDVGRLIYLEDWEFDESSAARTWQPATAYGLNAIRRYGANVYAAVEAGTSGTTPPTHTDGVQSDGTVRWRYLNSGHGVAKITSFVSANEVKAETQSPLPAAIIDGYGSAGTTWTHSGDGTTTAFAIAGALITLSSSYLVTVDGVRKIPYVDYLVNQAGASITFFTPPPLGVNNIVIAEKAYALITTKFAFGAWSAESGYPGCVSYFGGRIAYAGSTEEPQDIWLSKSGKYKDFGRSRPVADGDAIDIAIADRQVNKIRDLVALKHLVALTSSRSWHLVGDNDNVLTPTATVEPGDAVGISTVQAEVVGSQALYVDAPGNGVHKLYLGALQSGEQGYLSQDLSILAEHLLRDKTITDIAFQRKPYPILWGVRSDGYLLGMTYNPQHEVIAWHQHLTDGEFESVACVNEGTEDALYAVIKRTINGRTVRYVERMQSRRFTTLADCFIVDAGATYSGAAVSTISNGLWHLEGEEVTGLMDGAVFTKTVANGSITLDAPASKVHVGLGYTADLKTLPLAFQAEAAGQGFTKNVNGVYLRLINSSGIQGGPDFDHLEEMLQREEETYGSPPEVVSGLRRVPFDGTWSEDGQACIRQAYPLPVCISQLVVEVSLGG